MDDALEKCLKTIAVTNRTMGWNASVVGPRFGTGLAGGTWDVIEPIINKTLTNIPVYIYGL